MGMAAIVVMWPRCRKQTFVSPTIEVLHKNLALIGQAVWEMFENCEWMDGGAWVYYKLT